MTFKNNSLLAHLIITAVIILTACQKSNQNKEISEVKNKTISSEIEKLSIDTFSTFPSEINGCSCYFSNDLVEFRKEKYIFIEGTEGNAFLKINGKLTKFTLTNVKEIDPLNSVSKYKGKNLNMTLETKDGKQNGDETSLKTGKIILTDQNKNTITKTFIGECGC